MADFIFSFLSIVWAGLIFCTIMCGIWVFFSIRKTFTSTIVFDLIYTLMLVTVLFQSPYGRNDPSNMPLFLITFITFFLNLALTFVLLIEWRNTPSQINEYFLWLKIAISIIGVFTIFPLALYYLKLYFLPRHGFPSDTTGMNPDQPNAMHAFRSADPGQPAAVQSPASLPLELAERYPEWEYLGKGGFARVFKVKKKDGTSVALKIPLVLDGPTGKTFIAELQNWTGLTHENIVQVCDFNILPIPYFEMELCDGSLATEKKPVSPSVATALVFDICEGLCYCHARNIIHRDLKPSNILLKDGIVKISDWGLSKVLSESNVTSSQISFSPNYAAPEQITGAPKDERTDVWQVGVIFYELITGTMPFKGDNFIEVLANITTRDPPPPSSLVTDAHPLDRIILTCLRKDPKERYQSIAELQNELAAFIRQDFSALLNQSVSLHDGASSARYCSELVLISLKTGDLLAAQHYASDLAEYADNAGKPSFRELVTMIQKRIRDEPRSVPGDIIYHVKKLIVKENANRDPHNEKKGEMT